MADPKGQQIIDALVALLRDTPVGDHGATYWYSTGKVGVFPEFNARCVDTSVDGPIYIISPGEGERRNMAYGVKGNNWPLDLTLAIQFEPGADENPFDPPNPDRLELQQRMLRDVEKAINSDSDLGGLAIDVDLERDEQGGETWTEGWALAFATVRVQYSYPAGTP
jgi:hypothetical protein